MKLDNSNSGNRLEINSKTQKRCKASTDACSTTPFTNFQVTGDLIPVVPVASMDTQSYVEA